MSNENLETKGTCNVQNLAIVLEAIKTAYFLIRKCATEINCAKGRSIAESLSRIMENIHRNPIDCSMLPNQINVFLDFIRKEHCPITPICIIVLTKLSELLSNVNNAHKLLHELQELRVEWNRLHNEQFMKDISQD